MIIKLNENLAAQMHSRNSVQITQRDALDENKKTSIFVSKNELLELAKLLEER